MNESYANLVHRTRAWFERAAAAGWFEQHERRRFAALEQATPADLFAAEQVRPLVIALFGGTGVGKSSLLNRLAGETIAQVGVQRPTSHEVTIFVHEEVELAALPESLPVERVRVMRHRSTRYREVLWLDAPDIDSVAEENRRLALAWLPHVDLVAYVVSPERYRDDSGWRILLERGNRHGWLFLMNHWDEGDEQQAADFLRMLRADGFEDPVLLRTSCRPDAGEEDDEFDRLLHLLDELRDEHAVREFTRLGHRVRVQEMRAALDELAGRFGTGETWSSFEEAVRRNWRATQEKLFVGASWAMQVIAERFAVREGGIVRKLRQELSPTNSDRAERSQAGKPDPLELSTLTATLWDPWSQAKLDNFANAAALAARRAGLGADALERRFASIRTEAADTVRGCVEDEVRRALMSSGNTLVRVLRRITGFLTAFLPMVALVVVAIRVVTDYVRATAGMGVFLGPSFAIHSALLVLLCWAVPFMLDRLLRPSVERAVLRALRSGFSAGLLAVEAKWTELLADASQEAAAFRSEAEALRTAAAGVMIKPVDARKTIIARLIQSARGAVKPQGSLASGAATAAE